MSTSGRKAALSVVHVFVAFFVFAVIAGAVSLVSMQSYAAESDKAIQYPGQAEKQCLFRELPAEQKSRRRL